MITKGELKDDANNVDTNSIWALEELASNVKYGRGIFINFMTGRVSYSQLQLNIDSSGSHIAFRVNTFSGWSSWVQIV